jgi:hypothetical protein
MVPLKPVSAALALCQLSLATFLSLSLPPIQQQNKFPMPTPNSSPKITVTATINAPRHTVWECYTEPEHIIHWNFAGDDWCCPRAKRRFSPTMSAVAPTGAEIGKRKAGITKPVTLHRPCHSHAT